MEYTLTEGMSEHPGKFKLQADGKCEKCNHPWGGVVHLPSMVPTSDQFCSARIFLGNMAAQWRMAHVCK